ncbi:putative efflux protein, MATE family [Halobiforma haloterrestris]|uniref:Putative efflux protein, MATE family n=1 Tax=Natronobacterium haloterrestre TaxID=148448 RepID=A0A1I1JBJ7_NATHA|nr:MATE family efflux transporter [Halobiforma haloterrestris]SFC42810.1 putative efflux protein, MATE family [Halobiforma haloterrestris]
MSPEQPPSGPDEDPLADDESAEEGTPSDGAPDEGSKANPDMKSVPGGSSITRGSLVKPLFHLAWPIVVIQLLQVTYNVVDTLYLGRLSAEAVGAISLAFPLIFLLIAVAGGFTTAGAILVAQYTGATGDRSAGLVAGQTVSFVGGLSILLGIAGYFYTRPALELLPSDPETSASVIPLAADYMEVIFLGLPLMFGFFIFSSLMRGYGDTRTPMLVMVVSVAVNVVLDPIFIFGFQDNPLFAWLGLTALEESLFAAVGFTGLGIEGAALATVLARGVGTGIGLWLLFGTGLGPTVDLAHLRPDFGFIEDIVRLGTPSMVEQSTSALAMIALTAIVVTFSPPVVSAYGLGNRLISLVFLPAMGLGRAIDTMVGQNLGADRADRAARSAWLAASTGAGVMLLVAVIAVAFTEPIVSAFLGDVPDAPETIALGVEYVRIRSVEFAFIGVSQVMLGAFRGAGNTKTAMVISIITLWVGRVGTVFTLVFILGWGETGIWVGMAVGNVLGAIVGATWFARGTWKEKYIDEDRVDEQEPVSDSAAG